MTTSHILLAIGIVAFALMLWVIVWFTRIQRTLSNRRLRPSFICPSCSSEQIDVLSSGLWDGEDQAGRGACGIFEYGICKQCGGRCARFHDDQSFVPTEEQWQSHFGPIEIVRRDRESLPFESRDGHHVT